MAHWRDLMRELKEGRPIQIIDGGASMRGRIEPKSRITLEPVDYHQVRVDDIVLVKWKGNSGNYILHLVKEIKADQFLIANALGKINGWASGPDIIARATTIEKLPEPPVQT